MADPKEHLKKRIDELKEQVRKKTAESKDPRKDPELRRIRKELKRAQRRLVSLTPVPLEIRVPKYQKLLDLVTKQASDLTKDTKKSVGDPFVHSLRKRMKSLSKRIKKVNRLLKKKAAPATPSPAPGAEPPKTS